MKAAVMESGEAFAAASVTAVDPDLIAPLQLPRNGSVRVHTPSTGATSIAIDQYDASIVVPGNSPDGTFVIGALPILATRCSRRA